MVFIMSLYIMHVCSLSCNEVSSGAEFKNDVYVCAYSYALTHMTLCVRAYSYPQTCVYVVTNSLMYVSVCVIVSQMCVVYI